MKQSKGRVCKSDRFSGSWKKMPEGGDILIPGSSSKYKTGSWRTARPFIDDKKCIQCMMCVQFCPDLAIASKKGKRQPVKLDFCKGCGICAKVCPVKCIAMKPEGDFQ